MLTLTKQAAMVRERHMAKSCGETVGAEGRPHKEQQENVALSAIAIRKSTIPTTWGSQEVVLFPQPNPTDPLKPLMRTHTCTTAWWDSEQKIQVNCALTPYLQKLWDSQCFLLFFFFLRTDLLTKWKTPPLPDRTIEVFIFLFFSSDLMNFNLFLKEVPAMYTTACISWGTLFGGAYWSYCIKSNNAIQAR